MGDGREQVGFVGGRADTSERVHQRKVEGGLSEAQSGVVGRVASHPPLSASDISIGVGSNDRIGDGQSDRDGDRSGHESVFNFAVDHDRAAGGRLAGEDVRLDAGDDRQQRGHEREGLLREGQGDREGRPVPRAYGDTSVVGQVSPTVVGGQDNGASVSAAIQEGAGKVLGISASPHSDGSPSLRSAIHQERSSPVDGGERKATGGHPAVHEAHGSRHVEEIPAVRGDGLNGGRAFKGGGQGAMVSKIGPESTRAAPEIRADGRGFREPGRFTSAR